MNIALIITALLTVVILVGRCEQWDAFVYPDKTHLSFNTRLGPFKSLEECRDNAKTRLYEFSKQTHPGIEGDYECGKNCDNEIKLGGVSICEETIQ